MSELKHTKGNWEAGKPNADQWSILSNGVFICMLPTNTKEAEANAKLIATAPELLEALKELLNINPHSVDVLPRINAEKKAALAIQKATT